MALSVEQFVARLTDSGLMSAAEVSQFQETLPPDKRPRDVQALAAGLVKAGKLTKYQAQAVYQGKTKGLVFDEYVVLDKLGEGGMGVVLKARHRRMDRLVAIKVLSAGGMKAPEAVERFHREVQAAARLSHPNIVTAHDAGEHQGMHYLVTEYVAGKDLAAIIHEKGPLPVAEAVECIVQAARGLQYAHEEGIVHRDIKPSNLLVDKKGTVKILDMGLARIAGADAALGGPDRLTASGQVMGTCDYMAPEQAMDSHTVDARADIYALGCTLYRLLVGQPPYRGETLMQILMAHQQAPIPSLCAARAEVPAELDELFQRMVAKRPEDRYPSMGEVLAELEAVSAVLSGRSAGALAATAELSSGTLAKSLAFLQEDAPPGTPAKQRKPTAAERTQPRIGREHDTGSDILGKARGAVAKLRQRPLVLLGLAGGLVLLLGIVLMLTLRHGTLLVEIDEQLGKEVQVAVSQGGEKVQLVDAKSNWTLSLGAGKYDLSVQGGDDQFQLDSESVTVRRGGQVKVRVTMKPPPLAVAPFDALQARKHQEAGARYLGVPVEITNSIGMKLVLIPPGEFMMGSPKELIEEELKAHAGDRSWTDNLPGEGPQHRVRLTKPFYLGVTEVTQGEYQRVMGTNPSEFSATGKQKDKVGGQDTKRFPVEYVSWDDAVEFCRKLSNLPEEKLAGRSYRLPSEAQWEYACRAGSTGRFSFSSGRSGIFEEQGLSDYAWFDGNSGTRTHPVGGKQASAWGLYDIHGNVWEWCQDWYDKKYYTNSPMDDPGGPPGGSDRVLRGGGCPHPAGSCRSARRGHDEPGNRYGGLGFRASLVLADTAAERAKMSRTTDAARPSVGSAANKPSPAPPAPNPQSPIPPPAAGSLVGADGKWRLAPSAPPPAVAPFDAAKAKEHQEGWAKHLGVPVEITNSIGMKLVLIPPGEFQMGSPKELIEEESKAHADDQWYKDRLPGEGPQHRVRITKPFYLGMYVVTQEEYQRVMGSNPSEFSATGKGKDKVGGQDTRRFPVENVLWDEAVEFCRKLSNLPGEKVAGRTYRLPSEAQWEHACRAGSMGRFSFSSGRNAIPTEYDENALSEYGWFSGNSGGMAHAVGGKRASAWGLYDMHGNVWEWCQDWYDKEYYTSSPIADPGGPPGGSHRVIHGGDWASQARHCRSAYRVNQAPGAHNWYHGFRASRVLADK